MTDARPAEPARDCCPYCGTRQIGAAGEADYDRCHGCNFYISPSWLVDDPDEYVLDDENDVLCPWCGYPVGLKQPLAAGDEELICEGCSGTLIGEMLVTQHALRHDRRAGRRDRNLILVVVTALLVALLILTLLAG